MGLPSPFKGHGIQPVSPVSACIFRLSAACFFRFGYGIIRAEIEVIVLMFLNLSSLSIQWAFLRLIGAAFMHAPSAMASAISGTAGSSFAAALFLCYPLPFFFTPFSMYSQNHSPDSFYCYDPKAAAVRYSIRLKAINRRRKELNESPFGIDTKTGTARLSRPDSSCFHGLIMLFQML